MTKDEALKLALEALHGFIPYLPLNDEAQCGRYDKAITTIKEVLAQGEEHMTPQAYLYICDGDIDHPVLTHKKMDWPEKYPHWQEIPLFMKEKP